MSGRGDIIPDIYRRLVHQHSYVVANSRVGGFRVVPFDKLSIHSVQVNPFSCLSTFGRPRKPILSTVVFNSS